jgi:hypothetical protein
MHGGCANGNCLPYNPNGKRIHFKNVYVAPKKAAKAAKK